MIQDSYDLVAAKLTRAQREKIGRTQPSSRPTASK
jgi:predicted DNA-binding protein (MmcQ/YjbR family)